MQLKLLTTKKKLTTNNRYLKKFALPVKTDMMINLLIA